MQGSGVKLVAKLILALPSFLCPCVVALRIAGFTLPTAGSATERELSAVSPRGDGQG